VILWDFVFKEFGRHRLRTGLTITGIAIGILLVTSMGSLSEGVNESMEEGMGMISGMIFVVQGEEGSFASFFSSQINEEVVDGIRDISGVDRVASMIMMQVPEFPIPIGGFDLNDFDMFNIPVDPAEGRFPEKGEYTVGIGYDVPEAFGYDVGDEITLRGQKFEIVGRVSKLNTEDDLNIYMPIDIAQELSSKEGIVNAVLVTAESAGDIDNVAREIEDSYDDITAYTDKEAKREFENITSQFTYMIYFLGSISAIIAGVGIMNVMFMSVKERRRELGTMKALGATTGQILGIVISEAVILSFIGATIGIILSYGVAGIVNDAVKTELATITPNLIILSLVFAISIGVLGGFLPARQASKLDPAEVLRYE